MRRDIMLRNRKILCLYKQGTSLKQIPYHLDWIPRMTYEAIKKVIWRQRAKLTARRAALNRIVPICPPKTVTFRKQIG